MAPLESLSPRSMAAAVTVLVVLSFWATKAAREEVTTRSATRMKERANADSWIAKLFRERPRGRTVVASDRGRLVLMPPHRAAGALT